MGYQDSVAGTALTEAFLDEVNKQLNLLYATAAARNADAALSAACREGILSFQADTNSFIVQRDATLANISTIGPVHGALTSWTPVVVQGATPTLTVNQGTYSRIGRQIFFEAVVTITSAGTAANVVTFSLPVAAKAYSIYSHMGTGEINDTSATTLYPAILRYASSTTVKFTLAASSTDPAYLGVTLFTAALANNDIISVRGFYEASADA